MSESDALVTEARKALCCLYIAVDEHVADDVRAKVEAALTAITEERDKAMALLNPTCADETLCGAIRNLQQAHLSEKGNAEAAEARAREAEEQARLDGERFTQQFHQHVAELLQLKAERDALAARLAELEQVVAEWRERANTQGAIYGSGIMDVCDALAALTPGPSMPQDASGGALEPQRCAGKG